MVKVGGVTLAEILFAVPYLELLRYESGQDWPFHIIVMVSTGAKLFEDWAASLISLMHAVIEPSYVWLFLLLSWLRKPLTLVLRMNCFDRFGDYCHACGIDGGRDGRSRVFTIFGNGCTTGPIFSWAAWVLLFASMFSILARVETGSTAPEDSEPWATFFSQHIMLLTGRSWDQTFRGYLSPNIVCASGVSRPNII